MNTIEIGHWIIDIEALLARIVYPWRWYAIGIIGLLIIGSIASSDIVPPFWRGTAYLGIVAPKDAAVQIDGLPSMPVAGGSVYAGQHLVTASLPNGRTSWASVNIQAGQQLTITLPAGLPPLRERVIPSVGPGMQLYQVRYGDSAWQAVFIPAPAPVLAATDTSNAGAAAVLQPLQVIAIRPTGIERLTTIDAYAGLADEIHVKDTTFKAVYRKEQGTQQGTQQERGQVEIWGWGPDTQTIPTGSPITMVQFSPDGMVLLLAEQLATGGQQLYLVRKGAQKEPLLAIPGYVVRTTWQPAGQGVLIHSQLGNRLSLTLIRLSETIATAVLGDLESSRYAGSLLPLCWKGNTLFWAVPDSSGKTTLWSVSLTTLIPEQQQVLGDVRALTMLPNGRLRVITIYETSVMIGQFDGELFLGEATLRTVQATADLVGMWVGNELMLHGGSQAWLISFQDREGA